MYGIRPTITVVCLLIINLLDWSHMLFDVRLLVAVGPALTLWHGYARLWHALCVCIVSPGRTPC